MKFSFGVMASLAIGSLAPAVLAATPGSSVNTCSLPASLKLNPSENTVPNTVTNLGATLGCGWKRWSICFGIVTGACAAPCLAGGFLDPLCDACVAALGGLSCHACLETAGEQTSNLLSSNAGDVIERNPEKYAAAYDASAKAIRAGIKTNANLIAVPK